MRLILAVAVIFPYNPPMDWIDTGIIISARRHGESSAIVSLFTENNGRHAGLIRINKKNTAMLQIGTLVRAGWRARLSENLGFWTFEPLKITYSALLNRPQALLALTAGCALLDFVLPEREAHPTLHHKFAGLLKSLEQPLWQQDYVRFELCMLRELGFGLDLSRCAATGTAENLAYVSPRTGRAVSLEGGEDYKHQLLPLPSFLVQHGADASSEGFKKGLYLTGYFLERHVLSPHNRKMPLARTRLFESYPEAT